MALCKKGRSATENGAVAIAADAVEKVAESSLSKSVKSFEVLLCR